MVGTILERSRPQAFRWTLRRARSREGVDLGCVKLYPDRLAWSRIVSFGTAGGVRWIFHLLLGLVTGGLWLAVYGFWLLALWLRGFEEAPLADIRRVWLNNGVLWIDRGGRTRGLPSPRIRNGLFLPEIVAVLQGPGQTACSPTVTGHSSPAQEKGDKPALPQVPPGGAAVVQEDGGGPLDLFFKG